mmetsp:Transcript_43729/g.105467  ORF Transcript_43729/g.105467 Transcript_43729/m.105467 type:complete len:92 (+) Transcript_43729:344-619(+)
MFTPYFSQKGFKFRYTKKRLAMNDADCRIHKTEIEVTDQSKFHCHKNYKTFEHNVNEFLAKEPPLEHGENEVGCAECERNLDQRTQNHRPS